MRVPRRGIAAFVRFGDGHVQAAEHHDADGGHEHAVIDPPRFVRCARPQDVDDGAHPVEQGKDVHQPSPATQRVRAGGTPALDPCEQRGEHDHLKGHIDPERCEADDGGDRVLQPKRRERYHRRDGSHDHEGRGGHMAVGRHPAQVLAAKNHLIAGVGEHQPAGRRLQAQETGNERHQHDDDDGAKARLPHRRAQQGDDGVGVLAGNDGIDVCNGQHEGEAYPGRGGAANVDRHVHRLGDHAAGVRRFLGDVAAGLEPVVAEHGRQRGGEEGGPIMSLRVDERGVDEHLQRLVAREQEQISADHDGADQLAHESEHGDARQKACAAQVEQSGHREQDERDEGGRERRARDAEQLREKRRDPGRDAGHRAAQGPCVDPACHPGPALAHEAPRPGIQAPGDGKLRDDFPEDEAHHELT